VTQTPPTNAPDPALRAKIASIDRLRRSRASVALIARLAPYAAGLGLVLSLAARWFGWSWAVPGVYLGTAVAALIATLTWGRRSLEVSDASATAIDAHAGLKGELHSAHWFAAHEAPHAEGDAEPGQWAAFHVAQASGKIDATDWSSLYPPVRAAKQWLASGALGAVAVIALINGPRSTAAILAEQGLSPEQAAMAKLDMLPADIQKKIDELLAAIKSGELSAEAARLKVDEIRALLDKLNAAEEAKAKGEALDNKNVGNSDDPDDELSKKAEELADASAGLPEDVKWSIDDLAARLANADATKRETNKDNASASEKTGEKGNASDEAEKSDMAQAAGMQMVREAASDAAEGQMMNGGGGAMGGDSRPGAGGNQGGQGEGKLAALKEALRQEMIQAQADQLGAPNIDTEIRRKTEESKAKVGFSRVATPTSFDRSRAALPPPVPEAHRSLLQRYFHRSK
jgi:hypothetical protein